MPTATERHARILAEDGAIGVEDAHRPTNIERTIRLRLDNHRLAWLPACAAIQPFDMQRARRTPRDDRRDLVRRRLIHSHPGARVGLKDLWQPAHTPFRMDTTARIPMHRYALIAIDALWLFSARLGRLFHPLALRFAYIQRLPARVVTTVLTSHCGAHVNTGAAIHVANGANGVCCSME